MNEYALAASQLRVIKNALDAALERCHIARYKDMQYIGNGIWINKSYTSFDECLNDLKKMLP
jgi:predicted N-acyltransferase